MLHWNGAVSVRVGDGRWSVAQWFSQLYATRCTPIWRVPGACSPVGAIPRGTRVPGSCGPPINSPLKREPPRHHDTGLSRWEEEITKAAEKEWSGKGKMKDGGIMYFMLTCAHLTICLSGIWQTACSLHYFFFSINLKVWTLHYKIQWQDNFPVAW